MVVVDVIIIKDDCIIILFFNKEVVKNKITSKTHLALNIVGITS